MKMKQVFKISTLTLFAVFALFSCKSNKHGELINTHETATYNIGFPVRHYKYFIDKGKEYVAFCDFATYDKISVHSIDGKCLFQVPLKNVEKTEVAHFCDFDVVNNDTFGLLSPYTNKIYLINKTGELIYKKDYSTFLLQGIELHRPLKFSNGVLMTGIEYRGGIDTLNRDLTDAELLQYYHDRYHFSNLFIDSSFFRSKYTVTTQLDSIYSRFVKDDELAFGVNYLNAKNKIYLSVYSDSIYVFNEKFKLEEIKKIHSEFYKIDTRPIKMSDSQKNMNLLMENFWNHSSIQELLYDKYRNVFFCIIRGPGDYNTSYMPFSVIVMDENLTPLDEQKFDGNMYNPSVYIGEKGLYVEQANTKDITKRIYTIFNYE